jgi:thioredoxin 1
MMSRFSDLINSDKPVLVDFHATWCGPCKMLAPEVEKVAKSLSDDIKVIKIDIDKNQQLAQQLNIKGVPTLMLFRKGDMLWRQSGVIPAHQIEQEIKKRVVS